MTTVQLLEMLDSNVPMAQLLGAAEPVLQSVHLKLSETGQFRDQEVRDALRFLRQVDAKLRPVSSPTRLLNLFDGRNREPERREALLCVAVWQGKFDSQVFLAIDGHLRATDSVYLRLATESKEWARLGSEGELAFQFLKSYGDRAEAEAFCTAHQITPMSSEADGTPALKRAIWLYSQECQDRVNALQTEMQEMRQRLEAELRD